MSLNLGIRIVEPERPVIFDIDAPVAETGVPGVYRESEETMPLNEADRAWVREAIQNGVSERGFGAFTSFLRRWSGFGAFVAILIFGVTQWTAYVEFRTTTNLALAHIDNRLTAIEGQQARNTLAGHAFLDPATFEATLPDLGTAIATVRQQKISISPNIVKNIQDHLIATKSDIPGFWTAAAELISYQSPSTQNALPDCSETTPEHLAWHQLDHPEIKGTPPPDQVKFKSCHLDLDLLLPPSIISPTQTDAVSIVCQHCEITYSGGAIPLLSLKGYVNLIFDDCTFSIRASEHSPLRGKDLITTVLKSKNRQNISYSQSG